MTTTPHTDDDGDDVDCRSGKGAQCVVMCPPWQCVLANGLNFYDCVFLFSDDFDGIFFLVSAKDKNKRKSYNFSKFHETCTKHVNFLSSENLKSDKWIDLKFFVLKNPNVAHFNDGIKENGSFIYFPNLRRFFLP